VVAAFDILEIESESERRSSLRVLRRDLREAAETLGLAEIRYLVDLYYQIQEYRKATGNQERALGEGGEPHLVLSWAFGTMEDMENTIKAVLDRYTQVESTGMGAWAREVVGIGPVLSAGLLAHLDIEKAPTVGHIWRFAGLDPTQSWEKGQKRPWNAALKVLCWKIGQSFVKVSNHPRAVYGHLYRTRKAYELERNQSGALAEQAAAKLARFKIGKDTDAYAAYSEGRLPPAHLDQRAQRWAVKQFLADWHGEAYRRHFGKEPPLPYPIAILGHAHQRT
jgi:hypothetical protein